MGHRVAPHQSRRIVLKGWTRIGALVFACAFLLALPSAASANIFLELDGIEGESNAVGFENQIELGSAPTRGRQGRQGGLFSDVTVTKQLDKSSPQLMLRAANGTTIPSAKLRFTTTGGDKVAVYLRYCLTGVRIAGFSQSSGGEQTDRERLVQLRHDRAVVHPRVRDRRRHGLRHRLGPAQEPPNSLRPFVTTDHVAGLRGPASEQRVFGGKRLGPPATAGGPGRYFRPAGAPGRTRID